MLMSLFVKVSWVVIAVCLTLAVPTAIASKLSISDINAGTKNGVRDMPVIIRMKPIGDRSSGENLSGSSPPFIRQENSVDAAKLTIGRLSKFDARVAKLEQTLSGLSVLDRGAGIFERHVSVSRYDENVIALTMNKAELLMLMGDSNIKIYENKILRPSLSSSVPVVFADQSSSDFNGSGRAVAVLDFGVSPNHTFLNGRLQRSVSACFSNRGVNSAGQSNPLTESLCINEAASSVGGSSGDNCSSAIFGCEHGTMMAGIIAGNNASMSGVALGAGLISVQVGTRINDETVCGDASITPCVGAFSFDIQEALNYVSSIAFAQRVAAVNISLGTEAALQGRCDDDPLKPAVDSLVARGVAVIASSGNSFSGNAMSSPACISNVVAVAATTDNDVPLGINNRSSELDFFAPGSSINTSSLPASTFASVTGTSAAAAHVSGAWAVLKEKAPSASVAQIQNALRATGVPITQGAFTRRRIRIANALDFLQVPEPSDEFCFLVVTKSDNVATICL